MKRKITSFTVLPDTPPKLKNLNELAYNLYFSWNHEALDLFRKIDPETWEDAHDNPVRMLCLVPQEKLEAAAKNRNFQSELAAVYDRFKKYMEATTWIDREYGERTSPVVAYFSAEYGIHECLPIYSGGLGALSGDHVKSASDLGVPLVAVGLLYSQGYFRQHLNADGLQQESYPQNDWYSKPVHRVADAQGIPLKGCMDIGDERVCFHVWRADVGRVPIYLMDTNIAENTIKNRMITKMLYDPDRDTRMRQEILLGIGGVQMLGLLGLSPCVYHVNEGHSAFLLVERIRLLMKNHKLSFEEAKGVVWSSTVFTTHTPVPAGNESFKTDLIHKYFTAYSKEMGLTCDDFIKLGTISNTDKSEDFSMTVLALRLSSHANGVSALHSKVSRNMWQGLYPGIPPEEIPIDAVVNGVHSRTWLSPQLFNLFLRYGGPSTINELADFSIWNIVDQIPDEELWAFREQSRRQLINYARKRLSRQVQRRGVHAGDYAKIEDILDPKALTIGFARRFATYKRAYMLFKDLDRLKALLSAEGRRVQLVIAGKAHPADQAGKDILKQIFEVANRPEFRKHIILIEDYDLDVASFLVHGVDVWLNNPRRPLEACGTSGMKAAMNGALNFSVLDGWWDEAYTSAVGWAIGEREMYEDPNRQDAIEADLIYATLEREIVPLFYERDDAGTPHRWLSMVKNSVRELGTGFNSHRMLRDYVEKYYLPGESLYQRLCQNDFREAKELASWREKMMAHWDKIQILKIESTTKDFIHKGNTIDVQAWIKLKDIHYENILVECYFGPLDNQEQFIEVESIRMRQIGTDNDVSVFHTSIPCSRGGRFGFTVRVLPGHPNLAINMLPGFIKWYE